MSIPLPEQWLSVNIWNLIAQNGNSFIFQDYDVKDFDRINIIWRFDDKYTVMNLGVFLRFAHGEKEHHQTARFTEVIRNANGTVS